MTMSCSATARSVSILGLVVSMGGLGCAGNADEPGSAGAPDSLEANQSAVRGRALTDDGLEDAVSDEEAIARRLPPPYVLSRPTAEAFAENALRPSARRHLPLNVLLGITAECTKRLSRRHRVCRVSAIYSPPNICQRFVDVTADGRRRVTLHWRPSVRYPTWVCLPDSLPLP